MSDTLEKNTPLITDLNTGGFLQGYGPVPPPLSTVKISAIGGGGGGSSGLISSGVTWAPSSNYTVSSLSDTTLTIGPSVTKITTPLEVNGRDILKELDEMRDSLLLLKRDVKMEEKYPKLKELKDAYERALEKYKTFDAIKDSK